MKKIKCYVIDDDAASIDIIETYIRKTAVLEHVGSTTDPMKGLETLQRDTEVHLVFLDVEMEPISGLELMQQLDPRIKVVLCTAHREFAVQAFDLQATDYLSKPFFFSRFSQAVHCAKAALNYQAAVAEHGLDYYYFFVKTGSQSKRQMVEFSNLQFVSSQDGLSALHLIDGEVLTVSMRIGMIFRYLPKDRFIRVHQSHIVNLNQIRGCENGFIVLKGRERKHISIGDRYAKAFYRWVDDHLLK